MCTVLCPAHHHHAPPWLPRAGDTFDTISQYFNIPRSYIVDANPDVNPATLAVNSFVRLPPYADTCPAPGNNQQCRYYVAQQGDSLSNIATAFSIALADLQVGHAVHTACFRALPNWDSARRPRACLRSAGPASHPHLHTRHLMRPPLFQAANPGAAGSTGDGSTVLQPGQQIKLPPFPDTCGAGEPALAGRHGAPGSLHSACLWHRACPLGAALTASTPHPPHTGVATPKPSSCKVYIVKDGDTLSGIAAMVRAAPLHATPPCSR